MEQMAGIMGVWKNFGFNMVILLAGLNGIDESYYEAADMDGAKGTMLLPQSKGSFSQLYPLS